MILNLCTVLYIIKQQICDIITCLYICMQVTLLYYVSLIICGISLISLYHLLFQRNFEKLFFCVL